MTGNSWSEGMKGIGEVGMKETTPKGRGVDSDTMNTMNSLESVYYTVLAFFLFVSLTVGYVHSGRHYSDKFCCRPG